MRRFVVFAALLGLTACGGEMLPEEAVSTQAASGEVAAEALCSGNSWECYCAQFKTQATCASATRCVWFNNRCEPTYE